MEIKDLRDVFRLSDVIITEILECENGVVRISASVIKNGAESFHLYKVHCSERYADRLMFFHRQKHLRDHVSFIPLNSHDTRRN